jgi:hypothetical protein
MFDEVGKQCSSLATSGVHPLQCTTPTSQALGVLRHIHYDITALRASRSSARRVDPVFKEGVKPTSLCLRNKYVVGYERKKL